MSFSHQSLWKLLNSVCQISAGTFYVIRSRTFLTRIGVSNWQESVGYVLSELLSVLEYRYRIVCVKSTVTSFVWVENKLRVVSWVNVESRKVLPGCITASLWKLVRNVEEEIKCRFDVDSKITVSSFCEMSLEKSLNLIWIHWGFLKHLSNVEFIRNNASFSLLVRKICNASP